MIDLWTPATVILLERWLWTLLGLLAVGANLRTWWEVGQDRRLLQQDPDWSPAGQLGRLNTMMRRNARTRLIQQGGVLVIGALSLLVPPPTTNTWLPALAALAFCSVEALSTWDAVRDRVDQQALTLLAAGKELLMTAWDALKPWYRSKGCWLGLLGGVLVVLDILDTAGVNTLPPAWIKDLALLDAVLAGLNRYLLASQPIARGRPPPPGPPAAPPL